MKELFLKYKSVVRFILLFLGTYLLLTACYALYLSMSKGGQYAPDLITHLVARQCSDILEGLGYAATVSPSESQPLMELYVRGKYIARIIEGCNAISIIILFTAFVVAFAQQLKKTALFILAGAVLIYSTNIIRIVILAVSLYHYPQYKEVLHGVVFPGLIYGMVFLLWMLWVRLVKPKKYE
ncbi:MAG: exosortase family protein XrtF [Flavobacteriales bacterium]|uniref:exosortase family protein XrtF n=1 Tax=Candidatus Ulvibacter alkanivorans TaxID=2267620 RepID=UPI000DF2E95C|nr:exosortase family protein XrtF [Candidatus Ulvibacter alkanivorans]MCH2489319.1 exosortase family protein XrtF [Flavobacteriales bacterium]